LRIIFLSWFYANATQKDNKNTFYIKINLKSISFCTSQIINANEKLIYEMWFYEYLQINNS